MIATSTRARWPSACRPQIATPVRSDGPATKGTAIGTMKGRGLGVELPAP